MELLENINQILQAQGLMEQHGEQNKDVFSPQHDSTPADICCHHGDHP